MKIMTFNLRVENIFDKKNPWKNRKDMVCRIIEKYSPDIIGVQELTPRMKSDLNDKIIKEYEFVGRQRSHGRFAEGNDILVKRCHNVIKWHTFWLSKTPKVPGSSEWYAIFPRICTTALIHLKDGRIVRVYNTHLDCFFKRARRNELSIIGRTIKLNDKKENVPVIFTGDFNAKPGSTSVEGFIDGMDKYKRLRSVMSDDEKMHDYATMNLFRGAEKGMHIDYIFVSDDIKVINREILRYNEGGKYPSDHYPVIAEISID